jgi:hypothetical protein
MIPTKRKPAAGALRSCGLHRTRATGTTRTPQPASVLQPAISCRLRDSVGDRGRSTPSRCTHRRTRRAAHLVTDPGTSSPPALSRSRRWIGARPLPLGSIKPRLLLAGACAHRTYEQATGECRTLSLPFEIGECSHRTAKWVKMDKNGYFLVFGYKMAING